jgi:hypothetical protein
LPTTSVTTRWTPLSALTLTVVMRPRELLEVARLEVVGAHAVGDLEAEIEARELGEQVVEVGLVDVDELVEDVQAGRAEGL